MKPAPFEYHAPTSPAEVVGLLSELGDGSKILAGGQSLIPILALRLTTLDHLVDLRRVDDLRGIARDDGHVRIGGATTQRAIERSDVVAAGVPLLARVTPLIGHFQIRNRGTIGGSLAHADPAAEYPAVAVALDATVSLLGPGGERTVPASELFEGVWTTSIAEDELLTSVSFPVWEGPCGFAVEELAQRHGDFALAGACVGVGLDGAGSVSRCAIALFGLGSTPLRAPAAEAAAVAGAAAEEIGRAATHELEDVPADVHASADYRRHVGAVLVARAFERAIEEGRHG